MDIFCTHCQHFHLDQRKALPSSALYLAKALPLAWAGAYGHVNSTYSFRTSLTPYTRTLLTVLWPLLSEHLTPNPPQDKNATGHTTASPLHILAPLLPLHHRWSFRQASHWRGAGFKLSLESSCDSVTHHCQLHCM